MSTSNEKVRGRVYKCAPGTETVVFNGRKYHRRPNSKRRHLRVYFWGRPAYGNGPKVALHVAVWTHHHGPVPDGCLVHHKDENPLNNDISNLECVTASSMARFIKMVAAFVYRATYQSTPIFASTAESSIGHSVGIAPSFAVQNAVKITLKREYARFAKESLRQRRGEKRELAPWRAQPSCVPSSTVIFAKFAGPNTKQTAKQKHGCAARNAVDVCGVLSVEKLDAPQKVYNLSVAETPEYFAEGVLVHNCIAAAGSWLIYENDVARDQVDTNEETGKNPEYGSFLWREQQERRNVKSGSPQWGIRDVVGY